MNKSEIIEKYGEEAYKKILESNREYYKKNKEKILKNNQEYYTKNKEKINEAKKVRSKSWYERNKEKIHLKYINNIEKRKEYNKQYNETHKNEISENKKKYYADNKDKRDEYNKSYIKTKNGKARHIIADYKREDKKNNRNGFNITTDWILNRVFNSSCIYCGDSNWEHLGCDRIDNDKAHTTDNCVCSCGDCNIERQHKRMTMEEFVEYRKTHPKGKRHPVLEKVVEINGKKVIKKVG